MRLLTYSMLLIVAVAFQASTSNAQDFILFDFQDGTDQGFTLPFSVASDPDADVFPVTDVLGDGNLWLELTALDFFQNQGEFNGTDTNRPEVVTAVFEAINDIQNVTIEYDYLIDVSNATFTDPAQPFQEVGHYFQSPGANDFPFTRYQPVVLLGDVELNSGAPITGTASFALDPANSNNGLSLVSATETFIRFGFATNGNLDGAKIYLDNIRITAGGAAVLKGDVNLDGIVTFLDINPFIGVLSSNGFQAEADCDCDGSVTFLDIQAFINILSGSP